MLATFTLKLDGFITASNNCDYVFYRIFDPVSTVVSKRTMNLKFWILLTVFMKTAKKNICRCKCTLSCQKRFFHQSKLWAKQHIARSTPRRPLWQEAHLVPNILQPPNWQNVTTIRRQEIYDSVCSPTRTLERKNHKKTSSWLFWLTELFCEAIRSKENASVGQCAMCNANKLRLLWSQEQLEQCCQHNTCKLLWSTHLMLRPKSRFNSQFSGIITTRMELN